MSVYLKVKSKHLAEEAKIIRHEENKELHKARWQRDKLRATGTNDWRQESNFYWTFRNLQSHRKWYVRTEQRATFLVRGYLEGKSYRSIEVKSDMHFVKYYLVPRMEKMLKKYGKMPDNTNWKEIILKWLDKEE